MLKSILALSTAAACIALPASAESYVRGDGCAGTSVDRASHGLVGNITGGTRYKCSPVASRRAVATAPRVQARPAARTQTYTAPRQTYSAPRQSYSNRGYTTTQPRYSSGTTYSSGQRSSGGYVTTQPRSTYSSGNTYSSGGYVTTQPSYGQPSRGYTTSQPRQTYTAPRQSYSSGTTTYPSSGHNSSGTTTYRSNSGSTLSGGRTTVQPRYANEYHTITPNTSTTRVTRGGHTTYEGGSTTTQPRTTTGTTTHSRTQTDAEFRLGKPSTYTNAGK